MTPAFSSGLLPTIVQDATTLEVLMLAWSSPESFAAMRESGYATFFSRSRQELWEKGATSGNRLRVVAIDVDCDADAILVLAEPAGPTCHTGTTSCFDAARDDAESADVPRADFLRHLDRFIAGRVAERPEGSYTTRLLEAGPSRIAQKVGEEGVEVALAHATDADNVLDEAADLVYHLTVLLASRGLGLDDVARVLEQRHTG